MEMMQTAVANAEEVRCPQGIVIVDSSGELLGQLRMTASEYQSRKCALAKAPPAASIGAAGSTAPVSVRKAVAAATDGKVTSLPGGLPVLKDGEPFGAIGAGSESGKQDQEKSI